jgi:hypothetical protein
MGQMFPRSIRPAALSRIIWLALVALAAVGFFGLGSYQAEMVNSVRIAESQARIDALRAEVSGSLGPKDARRHALAPAGVTGSAGWRGPDGRPIEADIHESLVEEVKERLQTEMGLVPVKLLRECQRSFVELYATDNRGKTSYGTAGYLGRGYFVTVKHAVVALKGEEDEPGPTRRIVGVTISYRGQSVPAEIVDSGDADVEVHTGDWAVIRVEQPIELPALRVDLGYPFEFADPIVRLGNDYSKGIILSTGYVGQHTPNGLVTCLTDGHPGVSGGGILDQQGSLVGIPIGRMQGDFRFSFILPLRREMFRRVPSSAVVTTSETSP